MASRTVELRLRVRYETTRDPESRPTEDECRDQLAALVDHAANNLMMTGDTDLVVEDYRFDVVTVGVD